MWEAFVNMYIQQVIAKLSRMGNLCDDSNNLHKH